MAKITTQSKTDSDLRSKRTHVKTHAPNETTLQAMREQMQGKGHRVKNLEELFKALNTSVYDDK